MPRPPSSVTEAVAAPPTTAVTIAVEGLVRRYGDRPALDGVSFELRAGETLAVFGPNGAGKTTLLRILATLLRPHAGRAAVLGRELPREGWAVRGRLGLLAHERVGGRERPRGGGAVRGGLGLLAREPMLYRDLTARENLRYHARLHGVAFERAEALLDAVGMRLRADEPVRTLSRGMTQRVAICRAVLHEPELLLLDEPYANLDPGATALVAPLLGCGTRVLISHDVEAGLAEADHVLGLRGERAVL